jgi:hypothetical protein
MLQAAPPDPNGRRHEDGDLTGRRLAVTRLRNIRERAREKGPAESPVTVPTSETFLSLFGQKKMSYLDHFLPASPITVEGSSQRFRALCFVGQDKALARVP